MINTSSISKIMGGINDDSRPVLIGRTTPPVVSVKNNIVARAADNVQSKAISQPIYGMPPTNSVPFAVPIANLIKPNNVTAGITGKKPVTAVPVTKPSNTVKTMTAEPTIVKTAVKTVAVIDKPNTSTKTPTTVQATTKTSTWNDNSTNTTGIDVTVSYRKIKGKGWVLAAILLVIVALKKALFN